MKCTKCREYSFKLRRCKLGKINPTTIKGGLEAVRFMGLSYICHLSPLRRKITDRLQKEVM